MNKINLKKEILSIFIILISFIIGIYFYQHFPNKIAGHWGLSGQVDGYTSKEFGAFGIPGIMFGIWLLFLVLPFLDPKKDRYVEFDRAYNIFKTSFVILFFMLFISTGIYNLGYSINIGLIAPILVGLFMIVLGNYLGKIKLNYFVGIKTPWTLSSETVWNKTHRLGGYAFILFGILIMISGFLPPILNAIAFILGISLIIFVTFIYSYIIYRKENSKK